MASADRLETLLGQKALTGIDFVLVDAAQTRLEVHFFHRLGDLAPAFALSAAQVRILSLTGAADVPPVTVASVDAVDGTKDFAVIRVVAPGGFAPYVLHLESTSIDPYFNDATFSFKASCPSDLDCKAARAVCPPEPRVDVAVDYRARDFQSFRRALLDFASLRYPGWPDRLEADAGVMVAELLSALGDELAYQQDRVGREACLETATQRRSLRRHARLVDYALHDGLGATAWLVVTASADGVVPPGARAWAVHDGVEVDFEVGGGLASRLDGTAGYAVAKVLNGATPHVWDPAHACLPVGATELAIQGWHAAEISGGKPQFSRPVILRTYPTDPAVPARVQLVQVTSAQDDTDPLLAENITRISWSPSGALPFELDLETLQVHCNVVPATAGRTWGIGPAAPPVPPPDPATTPDLDRFFTIGQPPAGSPPGTVPAIEREGPQRDSKDPPSRSTTYLFPLPGTDADDLVWLGEDPEHAEPEIWVAAANPSDPRAIAKATPWEWRPSFVGAISSPASADHFVLDDGFWRELARPGDEGPHLADYVGDPGKTVRFGDGVFGAEPAVGTLFRAIYRLGNGRKGNLPADAITQFDAASFGGVAGAVTNPLPSSGGEEPDSAQQVRELAPAAFRAVTYRAVRPEDYAEAARRLWWVEQAGATFRWTGSWLAAFVTPDPLGGAALAAGLRAELQDQLDRFRQAGRPAYGLDPIYADLDLLITVCVEPTSYPGDVKERVLEALVSGEGAFFSPDHFTFGTPLERAALEARVQGVAGVRAVEGIQIRRRGYFDWRALDELVFAVAANEMARVENDPRQPAHGIVQIDTLGGA